MDSYQTAILSIVGSVAILGGILLGWGTGATAAVITVDSNTYGYFGNPHYVRSDIRCTANYNCPGTGMECCGATGCACSSMQGMRATFPKPPLPSTPAAP